MCIINLELEGAAGSTSYNINQIKLMPFVAADLHL